jgi:steroid delta-isomerase-like uncharacterized protein
MVLAFCDARSGAMFNELDLLTGRLSWTEYRAARDRFLDRFARRAHLEQGRITMGLQEFVEGWNARDPDAIAAQFTPDGVRHQFALPEARLAGRDAIAQGVGVIIHAVPDAGLEVRSQSVGQDGRVTVEWTFTGTHENDFPGMPASGATFSLPGISVYTLAEDGQITEERVYWDMATLMAAAGVLG